MNIDDYKDESKNRFLESSVQIRNKYKEMQDEITSSIRDVFRNLFQNAIEMQNNNWKDDICYICILYLRSSVLTGSYKYQINLYEDIFYLDQKEIYRDYVPDFILPYLQADIDYLKNAVTKDRPQLKHHETEQIIFHHIEHYHELVKEILSYSIKDIMSLNEYNSMNKNENIMFIFGGYRDYAVVIEPKDG